MRSHQYLLQITVRPIQEYSIARLQILRHPGSQDYTAQIIMLEWSSKLQCKGIFCIP